MVDKLAFDAVVAYINSNESLSFDVVDRTKIIETLINSFNAGSNPRTVIRTIMDLTGYEYELCETIFLNSSRKYMAAIHKNKIIAAGFLAYRWSDSGDEKVCHYCSNRDGKVYFFTENLPFPGENDGCRCIAEPLDEDEIETYLATINNKQK